MLEYELQKPTKQDIGDYYWFKHDDDGSEIIVRIAYGLLGDLLAISNTGRPLHVYELVGQWAGPIPKPTEYGERNRLNEK